MLAGLGLIGGAGSVVYNQHGDAIVKIKDKSGHVRTVRIASGGKRFSCPPGTHDKVAAMDIKLGRIELTLQQVRRAEDKIQHTYMPRTAPRSVVTRYRTLSRRDHRLVAAYNGQVAAHNAILNRVCTQAS
jgi:hypothetical protein